MEVNFPFNFIYLFDEFPDVIDSHPSDLWADMV